MATTFRAGWIRAGTDFPNYYTAAALVKKGAALRDYYEWTWFQKQMNYVGVESQLGGYIPQTPLTMMPLLPLAGFEPQTAKRIWLLLSLGFLGVSFWLLARITSLSVSEVCLLGLAGYGSLSSNFLLGQYYVFLLCLLALGVYCLKQKRGYSAGLLFGAAFALKLYGGPLVLYFAAKRRWKPLAGIALACSVAITAAIAIFGWRDIAFFFARILPRALQGETLDPYNSGNGTVTTLLRSAFVKEPELNPQPLWNAAWLFFSLQPFLTVFVLTLPLLCLYRTSRMDRQASVPVHGFAWFFIALMLASPNTASYTFILLLLPTALLLEEAGRKQRFALICCYTLVNLPMRPAWSWLFPKVWLLCALFVFASRHHGPTTRKQSIGALLLASLVAVPLAWRHIETYHREPGRRWQQVAVQRGAIYSSSPTILRSGIVYESIGKVHYVLRWLHSGLNQELAFAGDVFHPVAQSPDGPIRFEMVSHQRLSMLSLDLFTGQLARVVPSHFPEKTLSVTSPDGQWRAFIVSTTWADQLWLQHTGGGELALIAGGDCNNFAPAWELDSKAVVFASDCGRGIGLPALYRAPLDVLQKVFP